MSPVQLDVIDVEDADPFAAIAAAADSAADAVLAEDEARRYAASETPGAPRLEHAPPLVELPSGLVPSRLL